MKAKTAAAAAAPSKAQQEEATESEVAIEQLSSETSDPQVVEIELIDRSQPLPIATEYTQNTGLCGALPPPLPQGYSAPSRVEVSMLFG